MVLPSVVYFIIISDDILLIKWKYLLKSVANIAYIPESERVIQ